MFRFREVERHWDTEKEVTRENQKNNKPAFTEIKPKVELSMEELLEYCKVEFRKAHEEALKES